MTLFVKLFTLKGICLFQPRSHSQWPIRHRRLRFNRHIPLGYRMGAPSKSYCKETPYCLLAKYETTNLHVVPIFYCVESNNFILLQTIITKTVTLVFSKALSVVKYFLWKSGWVILGMAIVIGFCAYTPFCTLTLKKPFIRELQAIPYIDEIEDFLGAAYEKYQDMQNYI